MKNTQHFGAWCRQRSFLKKKDGSWDIKNDWELAGQGWWGVEERMLGRRHIVCKGQEVGECNELEKVCAGGK